MAEVLLIAIAVLAGFVVLVLVNAPAKARAYEHADRERVLRPPEAVTNVELPPPHFNHTDPHTRRRGNSP